MTAENNSYGKKDAHMNHSPIDIIDAPYGAHERQRFDLLIPADYEKRHGLILFIHGGAWIGGDKAGYLEELEVWREKGYAAASINYHYIAPDAPMGTLVSDMILALYAIRRKAAVHGADLCRVLLTGISAGGHLSLLYAYSMADISPITPACVVDYSGPTLLDDPDLLYGTPKRYPPEEKWIDLYSNLTGIPFSTEPGADLERNLVELCRWSPVTYVTKNSPPTIIVHGQRDDVVPYSNATALRDALEKNGVEYVFMPMPDMGHSLESPVYGESRLLFAAYAERFLDKPTL